MWVYTKAIFLKYKYKRVVILNRINDLLHGADYDFIKTNEHLGKHVILLGLAGSYSYGTNIEGSDIDVRGITLNRKSDLESFYEMLSDLEQRLHYAAENTDLPDEPDINKVQELVMTINEKVVRGEI